MLFVENSLRMGRDMALDERAAPCCAEEEFPGFVWMKQTDGKPIKDKPDHACPDHALDCVRYAAMFAWKKDLAPINFEPMFPLGSVGDLLDYEEVFETSHDGESWRSTT